MNPYQLVHNVANEIQPPEKGILSHTRFNDDSMKIIAGNFIFPVIGMINS